ncbi:LOW QUALITY PROTEIN: somatomedin-B and thrombospondin type-1 domain-containing protein [Ornithorhynchus anatinus]|uniref:LOW QUALITY PROTEIN: somatomedin-B and thrombospondin type-1 domain-containing protein n=1 Tax=Ornithorhynchus anatinus TaxID=9258 RepID=UPI0019D44D53|nr:LOW QUALITY PROTEIN: somatomedin-B and thrombospondin type-1 domain-containing protein [Ornithorhynchus anatinus]
MRRVGVLWLVLLARACVVRARSPRSARAERRRPAERVRGRPVLREPQDGGDPCPALEERAGCLGYVDPRGRDCGRGHVPAFIASFARSPERNRPAPSSRRPDDREDAGYWVEFRVDTLSPPCSGDARPWTRWMRYLRRGHVVCADCRPPATSPRTPRCLGDGPDADGDQVLHWQAIGNPHCHGTWKKIQKVDRCSCPAVHSFVFA